MLLILYSIVGGLQVDYVKREFHSSLIVVGNKRPGVGGPSAAVMWSSIVGKSAPVPLKNIALLTTGAMLRIETRVFIRKSSITPPHGVMACRFDWRRS